MPKRKRVPQRTCICCGLKTDKRELLRVVSEPDDRVVVDATGKKNGRGAYVCGSCRGSTGRLRRRRLEHALKTKITEDEWNGLIKTLRV